MRCPECHYAECRSATITAKGLNAASKKQATLLRYDRKLQAESVYELDTGRASGRVTGNADSAAAAESGRSENKLARFSVTP
jgi:hypothetical protein